MTILTITPAMQLSFFYIQQLHKVITIRNAKQYVETYLNL